MSHEMSSSKAQGDLAKTVTHESDESWPTLIEVVAYFGKEGRKGKRRSIEITGDEFFGRNGHGAPITGEGLIARVERLRRVK
jgi:hypothetical protein